MVVLVGCFGAWAGWLWCVVLCGFGMGWCVGYCCGVSLVGGAFWLTLGGLFSLVLILVGLLCGCSLCLVWLGWFVVLGLAGWWWFGCGLSLVWLVC